jgi:hypothetical protein
MFFIILLLLPRRVLIFWGGYGGGYPKNPQPRADNQGHSLSQHIPSANFDSVVGRNLIVISNKNPMTQFYLSP